jgi:hypothetical protein
MVFLFILASIAILNTILYLDERKVARAKAVGATKMSGVGRDSTSMDLIALARALDSHVDSPGASIQPASLDGEAVAGTRSSAR